MSFFVVLESEKVPEGAVLLVWNPDWLFEIGREQNSGV